MINPGVVVRLLAQSFPISESIDGRSDRNFADLLIILIRNRLESETMIVEEEEDLVIEDTYDDEDIVPMDFGQGTGREDSGSSYEQSPRRKKSYHGMEYKRNAVSYWKSGKTGRRSFKAVQHQFRLLKCRSDLHKWETQLLNETNSDRRSFPTEKGRALQLQVLKNYREAKSMNLIVHDINIRKWALTANQSIKLEGFRASKNWVQKFKKHHRIVSRKITKFITKKSQDNLEDLELNAMVFVDSVRPYIDKNPSAVFNVDQSGFQKEMHSGRTLADKGVKKVFGKAQSMDALTHSYTIQPVISANGSLLSPLYVVLQEKSGKFGPVVERTMFKAPNLFVEASNSGKVSKEHIKSWLENVYFKSTENSSTLIVDALSQYVDEENIISATPDGRELEILRIPAGATGLVQPLDVYFFRPWKAVVRKIEDEALYEGHFTLMYQRDNILKLQSLIHHQFSSPKYKNLIKYAWYNSGYILDKPEIFCRQQNSASLMTYSNVASATRSTSFVAHGAKNFSVLNIFLWLTITVYPLRLYQQRSMM